ncbi:androgen-induced gene 1 protein-like isoform X1 [Schistocerca gregaria]|uniref:androgen-induced gene 1 protein-like isoform X1 n=1 Tax=Schistocerca gregaria TaxID=7010 RepID=UPI00211E9265|nr:androgen-induced gene 1 protein-like isoform X1 [Schistocerca gregaria]
MADNLTKYDLSKITFHLVGAAQFSFSVFYDWTFVKIPIEVSRMGSGFGGKLQFLTFWNAILQSVYFVVCVTNDCIGTNENNPNRPPLIRRLKDYLQPVLAFPVALFVGATFWGLYAIDRELVLPRAVDPYFPWWLNHIMHSNIVLFSLIEMVICFRKYPDRIIGIGGLTMFMGSYLIWTHVVFYKTGEWVYPVLNKLGFPLRMGFFGGLLCFASVWYFLGEYINNKVWAKEMEKIEKKKQ